MEARNGSMGLKGVTRPLDERGPSENETRACQFGTGVFERDRISVMVRGPLEMAES